MRRAEDIQAVAAYLAAEAAGTRAPEPDLEARVRAISLLLDDPKYADLRDTIVEYLRTVSLADALVPSLAGEPHKLTTARELLEQARLEGRVQSRLLQDEPLLDAEQVGELLGSKSTTNVRQYADYLRKKGEVLGLPVKNAYYYPAFQFDLERRQVYEVAQHIHQLLDAAGDPWGVASWWTTPSATLGGACPKALLGSEREAELRELADAELAPLG